MDIVYNNFSDALRKKIVPLQTGESATYRMTAISTQVIKLEDNTMQTTEWLANASNCPARDLIWDGGANNGKGGYVNLAYITGHRGASLDGKTQATPIFGSIVFQKNNSGLIVIDDKPTNKSLYEYLELTNYNQDSVNPHKQMPTNGYIFTRIQPALTARDLRDFDRKVRDAKNAIDLASLLELKEMCAAQMLNSTLSEEELVVSLYLKAEKDPLSVLMSVKSEVIFLKKLIEDAVENKVIAYDVENELWLYADSRLRICAVVEGKNKEESLLSFIQRNSEGTKFREKLLKLVDVASKAEFQRPGKR